jgi:hypothetical protein
VSLLAVPERPLAAIPEAVIEQWAANRSIVTGPYAPERLDRKPGTLRAVIGASAAGVLALDLRTDGPHALVGGTTGSGKSELLQAWILAMALAHSPQRLTFLLVDYKGGAAFKEFTTLPHNVGMVTDLDPHLVHCVLASLHAELTRRKRLFHQHSVKDLAEMERKSPSDAPPSLVIVVDEFAALVTELPQCRRADQRFVRLIPTSLGHKEHLWPSGRGQRVHDLDVPGPNDGPGTPVDEPTVMAPITTSSLTVSARCCPRRWLNTDNDRRLRLPSHRRRSNEDGWWAPDGVLSGVPWCALGRFGLVLSGCVVPTGPQR